MKALKVKLKNENTGKVLETITCTGLDAVSSMTVCSGSKSSNSKVSGDLHFPYTIDYWNLYNGIITVHYKNGLVMEVTRIPNL